MSDTEKLIDDIDQALAQQEKSLRAEVETRNALISEPDAVPESVPEEDDFVEINPWDDVYKPRARERRQKRRGEEVSLPYDDNAPRPRQRVIEHREKQEEKRLQKKREKEKSRKASQEAAAEAVDDLTLWEEEGKGRKLTRREERRKRIIEEEMANDDPYSREWLTPDETRAIEHREELRRKRTGKKPKKRRRPGRIVLLVIIIIIAALIASGIGLYMTGKNNLLYSNISAVEQRAPEGAGASGGALSYNGETWHYNSNLINMLVFGVGEEVSADGTERLAATGIFIWSYDTETKQTNLIAVPGHMMSDCPVYDDNNEFLHMNDQQIGASYASGGTTELRRYQNVATSVSNLFYGLPISGYLVVDMTKISDMNDMVGGITLRVLEDLTEYDAAMIEGDQIALTGTQAAVYVNERSAAAESEYDAETGLQKRQIQYLQGFMTKLKTGMLSPSNGKDMLEQLRQDTYSDMEIPEFVYMFVTMLQEDMDDEAITIPVMAGEEASQEIRADQDALFEQMLTLFYQK